MSIAISLWALASALFVLVAYVARWRVRKRAMRAIINRRLRAWGRPQADI